MKKMGYPVILLHTAIRNSSKKEVLLLDYIKDEDSFQQGLSFRHSKLAAQYVQSNMEQFLKLKKKPVKNLSHLNSSSVLYYVRCVSQKTLKLECFSEAEVSYNLPEHPVSILRPPFSPQTFLVCTLYVHIRANASFGKKRSRGNKILLHENVENSKKLSQCLKNN